MKNYDHLLGKTKAIILQEMGNQYNHYPMDTWTYRIKTNWIGRKKILMLYFENNIVVRTSILNKW